ncbi:MAG: amino acid ABC transporter permease, partial [Hyphomicrobiales bacterium]
PVIFWESLPNLLRGAKVTVELAVVSVLIGLVIGVVGGICRVSHNRLLRGLSFIYVVFFRAIPLLVTLLFLYYGLPAIGIVLDSFTVAVVGLSVTFGAFASEIVRAGIESINVGQMRAARSLGMPYWMAMKDVILPQALRRVLPPLTNEMLTLLKQTALVSVIATADLVRVGLEIMTWRANTFSPFVGVALIYLLLTLPMIALVNYLEKKYRVT